MTLEPTRILLVDDDEDDYIVIRDLFSEMHDKAFRLDWVPNYDAGIKSITDEKHDLYLVDYRLGAKTGLDLLRAAIEARCEAPIILLTGHGDHAVDLEAMRIGAADYLVKSQLSAPLLERSIRYAIYHADTIKKLREREENFRNLFNATFEGIVIHRDGIILDVNESAALVFGYSRREMLGVRLESLVLDSIGTRKDGTQIHLEVADKPYYHMGNEVRLAALRDVTARKQMESQILLQDRLASVGLLASSLAHEIGTPLGVIRGRAEFLALHPHDGDAVAKTVDVIISQIDRVSKLIRSLLNLARGEEKADLTQVELCQVTTEVLELMAYQFRKLEIGIDNRVLVDLKVKARAEAGPLHQVLLNLMVNSVHAIEGAVKKGRVAGHSIQVFTEDAGQQWALSVRDTGTGISPENLRQLFKPFFTTKDIGEGTGLGLATSYRIVEAWGGSIQVQSQLGVGTTFRVLLPKA